MNEETVKTSMEIILHAGDARTLVHKALKAISENDLELAAAELASAKEEIVKAHKVHTAMIQTEASGKEIEYSLLFTHAQDTLMTINSELTLAKELLKIFESVDQRIAKLEKGQHSI